MKSRLLRSNWFLRFLIIPGLAAVLAAPIAAQETPAADPELSSADADTEPSPSLSAADISSRADEVAATLLEMQQALESDAPEIADIPNQIDALQADLEVRISPLTTGNVLDMNESDAETLLQSLARMTRQLEEWQENLQRRVDLLDNNNRVLNLQVDYFQSVLANDNVDVMSVALTERVNDVILNLANRQEVIRERLDRALGELTRISAIKLQINEASQIVDSGQEQLKRDPLTFDRPPIWRAEGTIQSSLERLPQELRTRLNGVTEFALANERAVIATLLSLFVLQALLLKARPAIIRRSEENTEERNLRAFIERPVSLTFLLWAVVGIQLLLPPLPVGLNVLRALVVAVALRRILQFISFDAGLKAISGLLALFALISIVDVFPPSDFSDRILLLIISAAAIYFYVGLKASLKEMPKPDRILWWRLSLIISSVAPILLVISIVGLFIGAVAFADQVIVASLRVTVVVIAIVVIEHALKGLAYLFVTGWGRRWLRSIRRYPAVAQSRIDGLVRLVMFLIFLSILPRISSLMAILYEWLFELFTTVITIGTVELAPIDVFMLVLSVVIAVYVARFIRFTLDEDIFPQLPIAPGAAAAASRLIYYALVLVGILFALAAGGVELSRVTLVMSALGVGIGFGMQNIVNNFVSGLVLAFERPFQIGDIIETGALTGQVRQIGLRASRVRTLDGAEVIVPNADLIAGNVVNWTLSDRMRRVDIDVGVAYGTDPGKVRSILMQVAGDSDSVSSRPEPSALFTGFGDSSLDFKLRVWIPEAGDWPQITSDLNEAVHAALAEADIEIPFPQRTLHFRNDERLE